MSRRTVLLGAGLLLALAGLTVYADTILLEDGRRFDGTIVESTDTELVIEVTVDGVPQRLRFPHTQIQLLKQTSSQPASAPAPTAVPVPVPVPTAVPGVGVPMVADGPASQPASQPAAKGKLDPAVRDQLLTESFTAIRTGNEAKVVLNLTKIVRSCTEPELEEANGKCQEAVGRSLAEVLATNRFNKALEDGQGRNLEGLLGVTPYENGPMCTLLANLYNKLFKAAQAHLDDPKYYQGEPKEARDLLPNVQLLTATIQWRLRLDASIVGEARLELQSVARNAAALLVNVRLRSENKPTEAMKEAMKLWTPTPRPTLPPPTPTPPRIRKGK